MNYACLQLRFGGSRPGREYIQDHAEPVQHRRPTPLIAECLLLRPGERRVDEHSIRIAGAHYARHLRHFTAPKQKLRVHVADRNNLAVAVDSHCWGGGVYSTHILHAVVGK